MIRKLVVASVSLFTVVLATWGFASSYLDTAALLLDETRRTIDWMEKHPQDRQLADTAHSLADARVRAGRRIEVVKEAERAHPHLLLALEAAERALFAAKEGDAKRFLRLSRQAREEERTYRELLQQSKLALPELDRKCR